MKTKIKKNFSYFILSLAVVMTTGVVALGRNPTLSRMTNADGDHYTIVFNSSDNKFTSSSGTQIINTALGNPISLSYSGYSGALGKWGNIATDGYIANETALSGLINLSVTYGTATGNLVVSYGWWDSSSSSIVYEITDGLITSTSTTFAFDGYSPSFFKISASSTAQITSMTLTYSCEASEDPIAAFNGLVFTLSGSEYSVTDCDGSVTSIIIPSIYKGLPVTSIDDFAFHYCTSLTSITIPDSVTSIGDHAFYGCTSLTSFIVDSGNPNYSSSNGILFNESQTTLVQYPAGKTETNFSIPSGVTTIGNFAFYNCTSLTSITIPDSVTTIGDGAFSWCKSLTSITIPDSVTTIGDGAFSWCTSLTSITIPDSVTSIGEWAFSHCSSLTSVTIGSGVTSIGDHAFYGCTSLTSITIPDSVTTIGDDAFSYCTSLTSITIPDSVTTIGNSAFYNCTSLTSITIPDSVTTIGNSAFYNCTSLTSITIPDSVTSIGHWAFSDCISLTSVTIPDSVTSIGDGAFYYCTSLTSITIPDSVTTIGDGAFSWCTSLTIYAEASSKPSGWNSYWNPSNRPVVWGYVG